MIKKTFLILFFIYIFKPAISQTDTTECRSNYENWLVDKKLDQFFTVAGFSQIDSISILRLQFTVSDSDSASAIWEKISEDFETENEYSLSDFLFFQLMNTIKLKPIKTAINIQETYDSSSTACTRILVYFDENSRKTKIIKNYCKAASFKFSLDYKKIENGKSKFNIKNSKTNRNDIYSQILKFSKNFYAKGGFEKKSSGVFSSAEYYPGNEVLKFEVRKLRQEVLYDEAGSWVCELLQWWYNDSYYCNDRPFEYLKFEITYTPEKENFSISCQIDGRFSSGYYGPANWDKCNPMEPQFTSYLKEYTNKFTKEIYTLLIKQK